MSFKETVARWFSLGMPDNFDAGTTPEEPPVPTETRPKVPEPCAETGSSSNSGAEASREAAEENARLKAENDRLRAAQATRIEDESRAFAESLVAGSKILPWQAGVLAHAYLELAKVDAVDPYGPGFRAAADPSGVNAEVKTRTDLLRVAFSSAPAHTLTRERLVVKDAAKQDGFAIVGNGSAGGEDPASLAYRQGAEHGARMNGRK